MESNEGVQSLFTEAKLSQPNNDVGECAAPVVYIQIQVVIDRIGWWPNARHSLRPTAETMLCV
jgi:hypothetical protein